MGGDNQTTKAGGRGKRASATGTATGSAAVAGVGAATASGAGPSTGSSTAGAVGGGTKTVPLVEVAGCLYDPTRAPRGAYESGGRVKAALAACFPEGIPAKSVVPDSELVRLVQKQAGNPQLARATILKYAVRMPG
jgi:hypothetical protein